MKQLDIAKASQLSVSTVSQILSGQKKPSPDAARRLEKATGVPRLSWLYPNEYPNPLLKAKNHASDDNPTD